MIKTAMTEMFGIQHPIMLAGMNWISTPKLVAAVCNAGGLGTLGIAQYSPEDTQKQVRQIRELTDKPFMVNQPLHRGWAKENIQAAIEEKVPFIIYSLGKPWFVDQVHAYGGKVVGTIAIAKHAGRAAQLGCDALIVTGHEAAAHGADATSLVLIPFVTSLVKIPVIAAGGRKSRAPIGRLSPHDGWGPPVKSHTHPCGNGNPISGCWRLGGIVSSAREKGFPHILENDVAKNCPFGCRYRPNVSEYV